MSDQLLEEYKMLYEARAARYEGNPNYSNSYQAEKNLSDAMNSCAVLEEFKSKIGNLNDACSIALVKDESLQEKKHFDKHQEKVRVKVADQILEKVDSCTTSTDVITMVSEVTNKISIEISMDESHRQLQSEWDYIDEINIYEQAEVPDKYKEKMKKSGAQLRARMIERLASLEKNNDAWQSGWKVIADLNLEHRNRRLLPYTDEHVNEQLNTYKAIVNR